MNTLRVLLVEHDPSESERISSALLDANHAVIPTSGLDEASEALLIQKFDAVLLGSLPRAHKVAEFTAQLRSLEKQQNAADRTAVIAFFPTPEPNEAIDAYLPQAFEPITFAETVANLARNLRSVGEAGAGIDASDLPVLDVEKFRAQVAYDDELLVEIIDLFLVERIGQMAEMSTALSAGDYDQLARVAHTIKGSLGSLHAAQARSHAQELEFAAKQGEGSACRSSFAALESDLAVLEPLLLSLRVSSSPR